MFIVTVALLAGPGPWYRGRGPWASAFTIRTERTGRSHLTVPVAGAGRFDGPARAGLFGPDINLVTLDDAQTVYSQASRSDEIGCEQGYVMLRREAVEQRVT